MLGGGLARPSLSGPFHPGQGMFRSMLRICQDLLGNEFTDDMLASWEKLFAAVQTEITAAYARV